MHTGNDLVPSFITRTHARVSHSGLVVKCFSQVWSVGILKHTHTCVVKIPCDYLRCPSHPQSLSIPFGYA